MAKDTITQRAYGMSISDIEMDALKAHIGAGLAALENKNDLPEKLVFDILNGLGTIQKTYLEITLLPFHTDYAQLILDTLKAFSERGYLETYEYYAFLKTVSNLIENMMFAISVTYGRLSGFDTYLSERYDRLQSFEHRINSGCLIK